MTVDDRQPPVDPYPIRTHFGVRLRHWRLMRRFSQTELGARLGYDRTLISRVECGLRWPAEPLARGAERVLRTGDELAGLWPLVERERHAAEAPRRRPAETGPRWHRGLHLVRLTAREPALPPWPAAHRYIELRAR